MSTKAPSSCDLLIVDARPSDYSALVRDPQLEVALLFLSTGEAALESLSSSTRADWLVNMQLPDMTGIELLSLIRQRRPTAAVTLISDVYCPSAEVQARSAGATAYFSKPAEASWLPRCRARASPASARSGPIQAPG